MLFRTVYGPELEAIYEFIAQANRDGRAPSRQDIHEAFVPRQPGGGFCHTKNADDALAFLRSGRMIQGDGAYRVTTESNGPFKVKLLRAMRRLELGQEEPEHPLDRLYMLILTELFIRPNQFFVRDVHGAANRLREISELGGISREKAQSWKRVMEYLGLGRRAFGGFLCVYSPWLIGEIVEQWPEERGTLQGFFEGYFDHILPYRRQDGDLADAVRLPFEHLAQQGWLALFSLQDSPSRPYFGEHRWKGIARRSDDYDQ